MTVSEKLFEAVCPLASVMVTVKLLDAWETVGVPLIAPVDPLKLSPVGSAGETLYANGAVPPLPVTGVKEEAAWF